MNAIVDHASLISPYYVLKYLSRKRDQLKAIEADKISKIRYKYCAKSHQPTDRFKWATLSDIFQSLGVETYRLKNHGGRNNEDNFDFRNPNRPPLIDCVRSIAAVGRDIAQQPADSHWGYQMDQCVWTTSQDHNQTFISISITSARWTVCATHRSRNSYTSRLWNRWMGRIGVGRTMGATCRTRIWIGSRGMHWSDHWNLVGVI